jgi:hypothetical protein
VSRKHPEIPIYSHINCFEWDLQAKYEKLPELSKISLVEQPVDLSVHCWTDKIDLNPSINVKSKIIKGFGIGSKMLGMPTGNFR